MAIVSELQQSADHAAWLAKPNTLNILNFREHFQASLLVQEGWPHCVVAQLARGKTDVQSLAFRIICLCYPPWWSELENVAWVLAAKSQGFYDTRQESCMNMAHVFTDRGLRTQ